jgi:hypothetical protein
MLSQATTSKTGETMPAMTSNSVIKLEMRSAP